MKFIIFGTVYESMLACFVYSIMQVDPSIAREFSQFGPVWLLLGIICIAGLAGAFFIVRSWTNAATLVANAHKSFLESTQTDMRTMATAYHKQTEIQGQQTEILREMRASTQRIEENQLRRRDS